MARASGKAVAGTYQGYARRQEHEYHSRSDGAQSRSLAKAMRECPALLQPVWQSCTEPFHLPRTAASPPLTNTCGTRQGCSPLPRNTRDLLTPKTFQRS